MDVLKYLLSNGRSTGIARLERMPAMLVTPISCASTSSTECNENNAWRVYFPNGSVDANGKNNNNIARALAALDEDIKLGWLEAYIDCCKNKKSSNDCNAFRAGNWEWDLWRLIYEVQNRCYTPRPSKAFIVTRPKLREVFAADFRDRIVQHWITMRINPLFEERFNAQGNVSHNCRKGRGTASAVNALERDIFEVSEGFTREAWVCKIDVRSFFMSIDTEIMWRLLEPFIREHYHGDDIDMLLYLTEVTLRSRPTDNCIKQSPPTLWQRLPKSKSMFHNSPTRGLAIGNITSQLEANFYMSYYIEEIAPIVADLGGRMEQFVDDVAFVGPTKKSCLRFRVESERILRDRLGLELHPDKFYIQPSRHGIKFVGSVIMPWRRYTSNRTVGGFFDALRKTEKLCAEMSTMGITEGRLEQLHHCETSLNSYLGFLVHTRSRNIRQKAFRDICKHFWRYCYTHDFRVVKIKHKYNYKNFLTQKEHKEYGLELHPRNPRQGFCLQRHGYEQVARHLQRDRANCRGKGRHQL